MTASSPNKHTVSLFPPSGTRGVGGDANKAGSIAGQLRQAIQSGTYGMGERLPAERALSQMFGASRSTVREALRKLENAFFVTRRVGSGTYVSYSPAGSEQDITDTTTPLELIEVRLAIEPQMARLAAINATNRDLDRLGDVLAQMEKASHDPERFTRWDEEFHLAMALCSNNSLLIWIYRQVNEIRGHAQWTAMRDKILTPDCMAQYNRQHRAIYEALRAHDVDGVLAVMNQHLNKAREHLVGVSTS